LTPFCRCSPVPCSFLTTRPPLMPTSDPAVPAHSEYARPHSPNPPCPPPRHDTLLKLHQPTPLKYDSRQSLQGSSLESPQRTGSLVCGTFHPFPAPVLFSSFPFIVLFLDYYNSSWADPSASASPSQTFLVYFSSLQFCSPPPQLPLEGVLRFHWPFDRLRRFFFPGLPID